MDCGWTRGEAARSLGFKYARMMVGRVQRDMRAGSRRLETPVVSAWFAGLSFEEISILFNVSNAFIWRCLCRVPSSLFSSLSPLSPSSSPYLPLSGGLMEPPRSTGARRSSR